MARKQAVANYFRDLNTRIIERNKHVAETHLIENDFDIDNTIGPDTHNIKLLKTQILETAKQQHYWGKPVPAKWIQLETVLVNLKAEGLKVQRLFVFINIRYYYVNKLIICVK